MEGYEGVGRHDSLSRGNKNPRSAESSYYINEPFKGPFAFVKSNANEFLVKQAPTKNY